MRTRELLSLAGVLLAGVALAQPPAVPDKPKADPKPPAANAPAKPAPAADSLEATIEDALKYNSDIQEAQARIREAQIKLNKVRNDVMVQVAAQHKVTQKSRELLKSSEQIYKLKEDLYNKAQLSGLEYSQAVIELNRAAATAVVAEADLMKLVGRVPGLESHTAVPANQAYWTELAFSPDGNWLAGTRLLNQHLGLQPLTIDFGYPLTNRNPFDTLRYSNTENGLFTIYNRTAATPGSTSMADKLKEALERPVKIDKEFKNAPAAAVIDYLKQQGFQGVPVRMMINHNRSAETPIDLMAGELPLGAWLVAVQDSVPELRFVIREYGLLVTTADRMPSDGLLLGEFLRRARAKDVKAAEKKEEPKGAR